MWQPLLTGEIGRRAESVLDELIAALRVDFICDPRPSLTGLAGRALFWASLDRARPQRGFGDFADQCLDRALELLATTDLMPGLFGGFVGLAWTLDQLESGEGDDPNVEIDDVLLDLLSRERWTLPYDLVGGLAGIGLYALGRLQRPAARACLARVVHHLDKLAQPRGPGLAWLSPPELLLPQTRERWPRGYYNYGVAHGAPAAALVLAGAIRAEVETAIAEPLLAGVLRWQWEPKLDAAEASRFAFYEQDGCQSPPGRLAWCYGNLGAATTLAAAARTIHDDFNLERALAVARRSTTRPLEQCGVQDAGLCHGSGGNALLYARLHHETGEALFAEAARRWYSILLEQRQPGRGIAGFRFTGDDGGMQDDASFLTGATGVAAALLAGVSSIEPTWDRCLAASLAP